MEWKGFSGLNNRQNPEAMKPGELSYARNVDIDNAKRLKRREGYSILMDGSYHSLWSNGRVCLVVKAGGLYTITPEWGEVMLRGNVSDARMSYVSINDAVYYSNGRVIGYIADGADHQLAAPSQAFKGETPPGQFLEYFNGHLFVAQGATLWVTDALAFNRVDLRHGFLQFPSDLQMVQAVDSGLFVSDQEQTHFLAGPAPAKFVLNAVCSASIPFTNIAVQGASFSAEIRGAVAFFTTVDGLCAGRPDGSVAQLTSNAYKLPTVKRGAVMVRDNTDRLQLVTRLYN